MKALYIHIPFCEKKCYYCSFPVSIGQKHRRDIYIECLEKESVNYNIPTVKSIYLGGGTPSLLTEKQLIKLFSIIKKYFSFTDGIEISIEMNPESITKDKIQLLKHLGVNRFSVGVQTLDNQTLKMLGRLHTDDLVYKKIDILRRENVCNFSVDVMYGYAHQNIEQLREDVKKILLLKSRHVSLYSLMIEKGSKFHSQKVLLHSDQKQAEFYECVRGLLGDGGYGQYEISNFSKQTFQSQHNLNYWLGGNYIGLGMGAHSHCDGVRQRNIETFMPYIKAIQQKGTAIDFEERLTLEERFMERMLFGLRMNKGVNVKQVEDDLNFMVNKERKKNIDVFIKEGFLVYENDDLRATHKGQVVLDEICSKLW